MSGELVDCCSPKDEPPKAMVFFWGALLMNANAFEEVIGLVAVEIAEGGWLSKLLSLKVGVAWSFFEVVEWLEFWLNSSGAENLLIFPQYFCGMMLSPSGL